MAPKEGVGRGLPTQLLGEVAFGIMGLDARGSRDLFRQLAPTPVLGQTIVIFKPRVDDPRVAHLVKPPP